jgi:hypothetical protein
VNQHHAALNVANVARAAVGLSDFTTVDLDGEGVRAGIAAEEGYLGEELVGEGGERNEEGNTPSFISGMMGVARMTRPLMHTILSMSTQERKNESLSEKKGTGRKTHLVGSAPSC